MVVLVISTGRAGSSTVARILHTQLNVSMGYHFRQPDAENPKGFYEDLDFKTLNETILKGIISYPEFAIRLSHLIKKRKEDWGVKDPRLCHLWWLYLKHLPEAKIIMTERKREAVIESCEKNYGVNRFNAERFVDWRMKEIQFLYKLNPLVINFDKKRSDEYIIEIIKEYISN